jgi:excisionase family DNA binding protein
MSNQTTTYKTLDEAAGILRSNKRTLRRYITDGKIPFVRIGRKYLFRETDLMGLPTHHRSSREQILA